MLTTERITRKKLFRSNFNGFVLRILSMSVMMPWFEVTTIKKKKKQLLKQKEFVGSPNSRVQDHVWLRHSCIRLPGMVLSYALHILT